MRRDVQLDAPPSLPLLGIADWNQPGLTRGCAGADGNLTTDGVIYPKYTPFGGAEAGNSSTQLWGLDEDHTGDYIGTPPEPLTGAPLPARKSPRASTPLQRLGSAGTARR